MKNNNVNGFFWRSKKYGNFGEKVLFKIIKDKKHEKRYVSKTLTEFSEIQNKYTDVLTDNILKHALRTNLDFFYKRIESSNLNEKELGFMRNALHTRYLKKTREYKIPMNSSNPKKIFISKRKWPK